MTLKRTITGILIIILFVSPVCALAQETQAPAESRPFTLIMAGTRHFSDVDVMKRNVQKIPSVSQFSQGVSSQNRVEFSGIFRGDPKSLVSDIEGLAADRFEVQSKSDSQKNLVIMMRKLAPPPAAASLSAP